MWSSEPKGYGFDSQSGDVPGLWVWSLVRGVYKRQLIDASHFHVSPPALPREKENGGTKPLVTLKHITPSDRRQHHSVHATLWKGQGSGAEGRSVVARYGGGAKGLATGE